MASDDKVNRVIFVEEFVTTANTGIEWLGTAIFYQDRFDDLAIDFDLD